MLDTSNMQTPRVVGSFDPGFAAHDLAFSPDGQRVWISAANGPDVTVFDAWNRHVLFRVPVGPGPQHIVMDGAYVYLTSGYGSTIERVDEQTGRIVNRASTPYGSFELDAADGYVVTASLLNGRVAIYTPSLKLLRIVQVAPATRDIEITTP
jgi:DNA-binding beta-propeller fold protein YncE